MKKKVFVLLFLLTFIVSFTSCFSLKSSSNKAKETYSVFFIDNGVLQYFIKPLEFKSKNYTLYSTEPIKSIESIIIKTNTNSAQIIGNERLYINKDKKGYQIRYSGTITYKQLTEFVYCENPRIHIYLKNEIIFKPEKHTLKSIKIIKTEVIDIIELNKE